jgi:hypothetical protein
MWNSRDLALVVLFAVSNVIYIYLVGQLGWLFSGIPGSNMIFIIGSAIILAVALLMYEGRRWRFLLQNILFVILILPTYLVGTPFDIVPRIPSIINAIHADILYMSLYEFFKKRKQLKLWSVIAIVEFFLVNQLLTAIVFTIIFAPAFVATFINVILLLLPVSMTESVIGALIAFKLYEKIKKIG